MLLKLTCPHCSAKLRLKSDEPPVQLSCPKCRQVFHPRLLEAEPPAIRKLPRQAEAVQGVTSVAPATSTWDVGADQAELMRAVVRAFQGKVVRRTPTWSYRVALLLSAGGLCLLIMAYIACVIGVGLGMYLYARHVLPTSVQVRRGRTAIYGVMMHIAILGAGAVVLYSLAAPLFRWRRAEPPGEVIPAGAQPVLHCFVRALCDVIQAPPPDEIRIAARPNAMAGRAGRFLGFFGGKSVLVIGEPLIFGFDLRSLAGVIAHELGHFSQAAGGGLLGYIEAVTDWFEEATHRTTTIQKQLDEKSEGEDEVLSKLALVTSMTTWIAWLVLLQFAVVSRMIGHHLMRQQEFDADRYQAEITGSAQFARTFERLLELNMAFERVLKAGRRGKLVPKPGQAFGECVVDELEHLSEKDRRRIATRLEPRKAQWFETHPSPAERIAAVTAQAHPGLFRLDGPARCLLVENSS